MHPSEPGVDFDFISKRLNPRVLPLLLRRLALVMLFPLQIFEQEMGHLPLVFFYVFVVYAIVGGQVGGRVVRVRGHASLALEYLGRVLEPVVWTWNGWKI